MGCYPHAVDTDGGTSNGPSSRPPETTELYHLFTYFRLNI